MYTSAEYNAILFDLDGTLTDPKVGIVKSIRYALSKLGISEENEAKLISFIGAPLFKCLQEHYAMDEETATRAMAFYREYFSETGIYENSVYPGIPELLVQLRHAGKTLLVATLKPAVFAKRVVNHFGLGEYFAYVAGPDLNPEGLTKAEVIRMAMSKLQDVPKERIIMVGDRMHDVVGARENGIDCIAVGYGYGTIEELKNAGSPRVAASVEDLRALLFDRNNSFE